MQNDSVLLPHFWLQANVTNLRPAAATFQITFQPDYSRRHYLTSSLSLFPSLSAFLEEIKTHKNAIYTQL